jgi:hypothetical protein
MILQLLKRTIPLRQIDISAALPHHFHELARTTPSIAGLLQIVNSWGLRE